MSIQTPYSILLALLLLACHPRWRESVSAPYDHLPALHILLTDSTTVFSTTTVVQDRPTIIFYFDPTCEHCQYMASYLMAHRNALTQVNLVFVSTEPPTATRTFIQQQKLPMNQNITIGSDYRYELFNEYKIVSFPEFIIYNHHQELTKVYRGIITMKQILTAVNS